MHEVIPFLKPTHIFFTCIKMSLYGMSLYGIYMYVGTCYGMIMKYFTMLHMVKGRQYSEYCLQAILMPAPQSQRWSLTLDLDSDKFRCFNHRRRAQKRSTASKFQTDSGMAYCMHDVCYI